MRNLNDFSSREWLRLQPLVDGFKQVRNDAIQRAYLHARPRALELFLSEAEHLRDRSVTLVVAFEQPWTIDWLIRMANRHLPGTALLVFDNSRDPRKRSELARVCRERETPYLALPWNPTRHANRSHGMAMTWIYSNIVRDVKPRSFGFIDHDLIPVEDIDLGQLLGEQPFYGLPCVTKRGWSLWAGYCMYKFSAVGDLPLNFLYDFSLGLDTGARNWNCLYQQYDRSRLKLGDARIAQILDRQIGKKRELEVLDNRWIHLRGVGYGDNFSRRADFFGRLSRAIEQGATLNDIERLGLE